MNAELKVYKEVLGTTFYIGTPSCEKIVARGLGRRGEQYLVYVQDVAESLGCFRILFPFKMANEKRISWRQSAYTNPVDIDNILFFCPISEISAELLEFLQIEK